MGKLAKRSHRRSLLGLAAAILVMSSSSIWGASWREMSKGLPAAVAGASGLAIDPATPSTLYSWTGGGDRKSVV